MKINTLFLFLILIIGLQSCKESSNPVIPINSNFNYPLKVGNKWSYSYSIVYSNIRPDSIKYLLNNTYLNFHLTVTKDTFLNSSQVFELKEESDDFPDSYAYYFNKVEGFLKYAYSSSPGQVLPKASSTKRFFYKGNYFNNITELIKAQEEALHKLAFLYDSLIFFEPPRIIYRYPFEVGKEWIFSSEYVFINKEIVGKEPVSTSLGYFDCFKIKWKFDFDMDGNWDEDIVFYEYVSSKGILKFTNTMKDITITSSGSPDGIGKADVKFERILTATNF